MDAKLKEILQKLLGFWNSLSKKIRILIIAGILVAVIAAVVIYSAATHVSYELVYSGLTDQESGQIVSELQSKSVKYKISGNDIYVDKTKADQARMQLAEDGYPQSTLKYSVYSSGNSWAMTDSDKQRYALYQLQDRLQDTIKTIPGVRSAVVTVNQGSTDTYVLSNDKTEASASVKLSLKTGTQLTQKQVKGIVQIVSHSVSNLSTDNVTVEDSDGNPLTSGDDSSGGDTSDQLKLQQKVESEVRQKVLALLNPIYGNGNVQVQAGATLDFTQKTTNTTTVSGPNSGSGLESSVSRNTTVTNGNTASGAGGVVGVNSYPVNTSSAASQSGTVTQENEQITYAFNTINQQVQDKGGALKALTVAVVLNSASSTTAGTNVADVQQTVASAVGTDAGNISVRLMGFKTAASSAKPAVTPAAFNSRPLLIAGAAILAAGLIAGLVLFIMARRKKKRKEQELAAEAQEMAEKLAAAQKEKKSVKPVKDIEKTIESSEQNAVKKQIEDFADKKPELVAQILKNWLKD